MADKLGRNIFDGLKESLDLRDNNLFRNIDWSNIDQFNFFQAGLSYFTILRGPEFMEKLAQSDSSIAKVYENYKRIVEYEFKGLDGIEDITSESLELTDALNSVNIINKVKQQSASTVTMRYTEKSGLPITKFHELYLKGIKDPVTNIKTHYGLIEEGITKGNPSEEVFIGLYFVTDNTGINIEAAYLLINAQPAKAEYSIVNSTKGEDDAKEVSVEWNCYPIKHPDVTALARKVLPSLGIIKNSEDIKIKAVEDVKSEY